MAGQSDATQSEANDDYANRLQAARDHFAAKHDPIYEQFKDRPVKRSIEVRPGRGNDFTVAQVVSGREQS